MVIAGSKLLCSSNLITKNGCKGSAVKIAQRSRPANISGNLFLATRLFFLVCIQMMAAFDGKPTSSKVIRANACAPIVPGVVIAATVKPAINYNIFLACVLHKVEAL